MNDIDLLRSVRPPDGDAEAAQELARERLRSAIAAERQTEAGALTRVRQWGSQRRPGVPGFSLGAVTSAAVLLIAVVVAVRALAPAPATASLSEMAEIAAAATAPAAGDSTWVYSRSTGVVTSQESTPAGTILIFTDKENEVWLAGDGTTVVQNTVTGLRFADDASEAAFDEAGLADSYNVGFPEIRVLAPGEAQSDDIESFFTDQADDSDATTAEVLESALQVLTTAGSTPVLRASVFRALDERDDVTVTEDDAANLLTVTHDTESGERYRLDFDATTSVVVADSLTFTVDIGDVPAGTVLRDIAHDVPTVVDTPPPTG